MPAADERDPATTFADTLVRRGLHEALGYLNGRTRHRFTGVYHFDPPLLRSICLFDRENPALTVGGDTPMDESYCSLVGRDRAPFATADAGGDARLRSHPARTSVLAYCGAPLLTGDGACIGTLCHFDVRPRLVPVAELRLLERLAALVATATGWSAPARRERVEVRLHQEGDQLAGRGRGEEARGR